jgi:hypothetical protein
MDEPQTDTYHEHNDDVRSGSSVFRFTETARTDGIVTRNTDVREVGFNIDRPPLFCDNSAVLQHIIDYAPQPGFGTKQLALYTKILSEACTRIHRAIYGLRTTT